AGIRPPSARYGLQLASQAFSSAFVEASSNPPNTEATRTGASRLSCPQHTNAPAQRCGTIRWYELKLGAVKPQSPGRCSSKPAMKERASPESRSGAELSWKLLRFPSQSEKWTCAPLPALSGHG